MSADPAFPSLNQIEFESLDEITLPADQAAVTFKVTLQHNHITQRLFFALLDRGKSHGVAVSVHPATGEVSNLLSGGEVEGYLSHSPLPPNSPVTCRIRLTRHRANFVATVQINEEDFLFPAFVLTGEVTLTGLVGIEKGSEHSLFSCDGTLSLSALTT